MDDAVKVILKKLDDIDSRLKSLETPGGDLINTASAQKVERDPLFHKAVEAMDKMDEMSSKQLSEALKIDVERAEAIMDQMEAAGLGTCYTKET
jgi:DNA segregation ATPase FtsK/SpoIIIE-like protein